MKFGQVVGQFMITLGALVLVGAVGWAIFWSLQQLPKELAAAIITGSLALIGVFTAKYLERRQELRSQHRTEQLPIYQDFITFIFRIFKNENPEGLPWPEEELKRHLIDFATKMLLYGSNEVIQKYAAWRGAFVNQSNEINDLRPGFNALADLLLAIRKDLGHTNVGLQKPDLFWMFMNNPELFLTATPEELQKVIEAEHITIKNT